jgi:hypothetical protein
MHEGSRAFQKCYVERNNTMPAFYHHVKNHGIIDLSDGAVHHIRVVATDHEGNRSVLHTLLRYDPVSTAFRPRTGQYMMALSPDSDNVIKGDGFSAIIPGRYLLDSVYINYSSTPSTAPGVYSNVIKIGDSYDLLGYFSLSVRAVNLPDRLRDKAVVVWRNAAGGTAVRGGTWTGDMLTAQCREFGSFYIVIDTIPPRITPINIIRGKNMHLAKNIAVAISDNLSGIADYHGYIDGKWQLMELDGKTAVLRMALPHDLSAGEHKFKLVVTDDRQNSSEFTKTFIY